MSHSARRLQEVVATGTGADPSNSSTSFGPSSPLRPPVGVCCALLSDGTVHCWGGNNAGQLGNGTKTNSNMPIEVPGITNAIAIAAGGFNSCALLADGTVLCWGYNDYGQLGSLGADTCDKPTGEKVVLSVNCSTVPIIVGQFTNAAALAVDGATACVLFNGGTVRCWGDNEYGQHGNGNSGDVTATVTGLTNAVSVVSSNGHSCALLSDGRVECWGLNDFGQLGNGTTTNSPVPVTVNGF